MSTKSLAALEPLQSVQTRKISPSAQSSTAAAMLLLDFLALSVAFGLSVLGRHALTPSYHFITYLQFFPCIAALLFGFGFQGLYPGVLLHPADEMRKIFLAVTTIFLLVGCSTFLWRNAEIYSRSVFLVTWAIGPPLVLLTRRLSRRFLRRCSWWGLPAIIIGAGPAAARVFSKLRDGSLGIRVIGVLSDSPHASGSALQEVPILGAIAAAPQFAAAHGAPIAILATSPNPRGEIRHDIQDFCRGFSHVILVPDIHGLSSLGVTVRELVCELGLEMPQRLFQRTSALTKRCLDLIIAALALICLAPVFAALAIGVRLSSKGSIFYSHPRCGRNGSTFRALKFRTMVPDADKALAAYLASHPHLLLEWKRDHKLRNDPRITGIGKWMRRFSLDELPQLLNVLAGQMSLIGPRPIVQSEISKYGKCYELYGRVRPGITGLWQVSGRSGTSYAERVTLDEFYVNNWSVWLDLYILSRTLQVVLKADGAY